MLHRKSAITIAAVFLALAAVPAVAANKSKPSGGSTGSSPSIAIASINGVNLATAKTAQPQPALGDMLTWATSTGGSLAGWEYPMVDLQCYQDVNGDGVTSTDLQGPDLVFTWLDKPDAAYELGGYSSIWRQRGGGPATCVANLDAYGWKGGVESIRVLQSTGAFPVSG